MNTFKLFLLSFLIPVAVFADGWDDQLYRQIEQSIRQPQFGTYDVVITDCGAKTTNSAAKNQKTIQKAIDKCAKKGGGKVIVPVGQRFLTGAITLKSHVNLVVEEGKQLGRDSTASTSHLVCMLSRPRISPSQEKVPSTVVETDRRGGHGTER